MGGDVFYNSENGTIGAVEEFNVALTEELALAWGLSYNRTELSVPAALAFYTIEFGDYLNISQWNQARVTQQKPTECMRHESPYISITLESNGEYFASCLPGPLAAFYNPAISEGQSMILQQIVSASYSCVDGVKEPDVQLACNYVTCVIGLDCPSAARHIRNAKPLKVTETALRLQLPNQGGFHNSDVVFQAIEATSTAEAGFTVQLSDSSQQLVASGSALAWNTIFPENADEFFAKQVVTRCFEKGICSPEMEQLLRNDTISAEGVAAEIENDFGVDIFRDWADQLPITSTPCSEGVCVSVNLQELQRSPWEVEFVGVIIRCWSFTGSYACFASITDAASVGC